MPALHAAIHVHELAQFSINSKGFRQPSLNLNWLHLGIYNFQEAPFRYCAILPGALMLGLLKMPQKCICVQNAGRRLVQAE